MSVEVHKDATIHQREVFATIQWADIREMLLNAVLQASGLDSAPGDDMVAVVTIKQSERGSPSYKIDEWSASVKVTAPIVAERP